MGIINAKCNSQDELIGLKGLKEPLKTTTCKDLEGLQTAIDKSCGNLGSIVYLKFLYDNTGVGQKVDKTVLTKMVNSYYAESPSDGLSAFERG